MVSGVLQWSSLTVLLLSVAPSIASPNPAKLSKRAAVDESQLPTGWSYKGCYVDGAAGRALNGATYGSATLMTEQACAIFCDTAGFKYAGVEYSQECFCGNTLTAAAAPETECSMTCSGDADQLCGGPNRLNVFETAAVSGPQVNPGPGDWGSMGCYADPNTVGRTLRNGVPTPGGQGALTIKLCVDACDAAGYTLAGAEYGGECFCDNAVSNGGGPAPDGAAQCNMVCNGNKNELCGGPNRLNVYGKGYPKPTVSGASTSSIASSTRSSTRPPTSTSSTRPPTSTTAPPTSSSTVVGPAGWVSDGCYVDSVAQRSLPNGMATPGGAGAMTVDLCTTACRAAGYSIAGLEYASECFCGNAITAAKATSGCNMPCNGNAAQLCGGPDRMNVYRYNSGGSSSTTPPGSTTTPPGSTRPPTTTTRPPTSTASGQGTATNLPPGWTYRGCWVDNAQGRIMNGPVADTNTMTIEICIQTCITAGYKVAGLQFYNQCFCDNQLRNAATVGQEADCGLACSGAPGEKCGGANRNSVYAAGTLTILQPAKSQEEDLPGSWAYKGCLMDNGDKRSLTYQSNYKDTNEAAVCLKACSDYGYNAGGMEYGEECWCGDKSEPVAADADFMPEADCGNPCPGNPQYMCGAGNRLSYYEWEGTPLNTYGYPSGNAAGEFVILGEAPVVALITTQGTNGKVTFVEKAGTSTTPGSTGAYEWDPDTNTFRTMHVKTDVFCSAGLVLPDKVGRQINIGGWSGDSTYGIRLYWPDGAPGQASTNDWEENFQELQLQNGRWYPTGLIMANGSILVVGGEDGSNGAPVPTVEILPRRGGVIEMEWLRRTDPYNLYPFLAVLPSGGIFVAYYNEARILDERTLATTKTLPMIPGAVNNAAAGRTYPLEGTMMLLPQSAPYTAPLGVLICGGSTPFGGHALDNCVTTTPETNAGWTIEKMPSRRVMSCMTALPDGTYLIINGAKKGVAGFGLAEDANHNPILYDPSKPVNQRMSLMTNTTIDRYYHSESILLQDGSVLVSGSDPETCYGVNGGPPCLIQEHRIEKFLPPYLKTGRAAPGLTVADRDWGYGDTIQVTVALRAAGAVKFSLMGAESSTHGNSMGQRTIFPAFTCNGGTCTITAPPNANVCPPGWFQLFALEGGVPSKSVYVRIGGDPANLGAWPVFPDFTVPGSG